MVTFHSIFKIKGAFLSSLMLLYRLFNVLIMCLVSFCVHE
ncbi:hypothetical protein FM106_14990 [Brachybacterium faecium]|nr:hypothetical protein FM106_14990 [Brachybacterium faecium]